MKPVASKQAAMKLGSCTREPELRALLQRGHWPAVAPSELLAHVARCAACRSLAAVTLALQQERTVAFRSARLEPAGVLWWRAQLRRRNAAMQQLERPFLAAQIFAVLLVLVAAAAFLGTQTSIGLRWLDGMGEWPAALHLATLLPPALRSGLVISVALGVLTALGCGATACGLAGLRHRRPRG